MIPRYSRPDMVAVWSPETKFRIWFEIEAHACDAMADLGTIPRENADAVWKAKDVEFDVANPDYGFDESHIGPRKSVTASSTDVGL